ncbi:DNA methylase [Meiothermus sp. PNK-Is4]|uniref:DNA methylase n=1 Tax=Meiothermus sp. PNK-Is4 TaxID=2740565 RepID=UPI0010221D97|nr:DNA methylase [Meiothermus sp. PNK-Is4]RYM39428.1 DNA methylase [Meiothermus sp. PNK-Is4]
MSLEQDFDIPFVAQLALKEKQIQQEYRPVIGVHKWFARRPGTVFRALLLSEFVGPGLEQHYYRGHDLSGLVIADPFMGGGTPVLEANRLGCDVVGFDINPMAYWIVRQELASLDVKGFLLAANRVANEVEAQIGHLYETTCLECGYDRATVKYTLWVKQETCQHCGNDSDLFPGQLVAKNDRHTHFVVACHACGQLNELERLPEGGCSPSCSRCGVQLSLDGNAAKGKFICRHCGHNGRYLNGVLRERPPKHRMYALEYFCPACKKHHRGRYFKTPDTRDLERYAQASEQLNTQPQLTALMPDDLIPEGDETKRLHRWGYHRYREMFNQRQLLALTTLLQSILQQPQGPVQDALLTVFSDILRYQNMLCRYDTYALKGQDIFSVHGFPVGLVQCEAHPLGLEGIGSGGFRHFVQKYAKAKAYCESPFEVRHGKDKKVRVPIQGEVIRANFVNDLPRRTGRAALIRKQSATETELPSGSLDGVFTDPPYFDNVQYAELMDFCYVWLRRAKADHPDFTALSTRSSQELTGNVTLRRGLEHFTEGLSEVFIRMAKALVPGGPFVFTYHHNDPEAYLPLVVALLDAGLYCTTVLPVPGEMEASMHIQGTGSSILDSVFVCRAGIQPEGRGWQELLAELEARLTEEIKLLRRGGVAVSRGDVFCLLSGHITRILIHKLYRSWCPACSVEEKLEVARTSLKKITSEVDTRALVDRLMQVRVKDNEGKIVQEDLILTL